MADLGRNPKAIMYKNIVIVYIALEQYFISVVSFISTTKEIVNTHFVFLSNQKLRSVFNSEIMGYTIFTLVFYPPICDLQKPLFFSIQHVFLLHLNSLKLSVFFAFELIERLS